MMNLENTGKHVPILAQMRACDQLSVNIESTNRAGFCGLRRKSTPNNARYLGHPMENSFPIKMDERFVYSQSGKAYRRLTCRDRSELHQPRLPFVKRVRARGHNYLYFTHPAIGRVRLPDPADVGFGHAYLSRLAEIEGRDAGPYIAPLKMAVYFVQPESGGPIKIGIARNVARRVASMQIGNHERLLVLATMPGGAAQERDLHAMFSKERMHGEWFRPSARLSAYIAALTPSPNPEGLHHG